MKHLLLIPIIVFGLCQAVAGQTFELSVHEKPERYSLTVDGSQEINLTIAGLEPGDVYEVAIQQDRAYQEYRFEGVPLQGQQLRLGHIIGIAQSDKLELCVGKQSRTSGTLALQLRKNRKSLLARAQQRVQEKAMGFSVVNENRIDSLLGNLFRNESCFEYDTVRLVSNTRTLTFPTTREVSQSGLFTGGTDIFGMESGVILSNGYVTDGVGLNDPLQPVSSTFPGATYTDPDATALAGVDNVAGDIAVLEFRFTPTTDTLRFNYIFFSEEYCDGVGGNNFNDAFAFILSYDDAGTNRRSNIAILPDGRDVNIDNVNNIAGNNEQLFIDNTPPGKGSGSCVNPSTAPAERLAAVGYDGFTQRLTAKAAVVPCNEYTLKLMVLDVGPEPVGGFTDFFLDSGVLLEAGSFIAGLIAEPTPSVAGVPGVVTPSEGCDSATIEFSRLFSDPSDLAVPLEVDYNLVTSAGIPVAVDGVDFDLPEPPFIIPVGQNSATLKIPILPDNELEGDEAIIIRYDGTCNCDQNVDTFFIQDQANLTVDLGPDQVACADQEVTFNATVAGGSGNYTYRWPDGSNDPSFTVTATGSLMEIPLEVTDDCGKILTSTARINPPAVSAQTGGEFSLCNVSSVNVPINLSGGSNYVVTVQIDSAGIISNRQINAIGNFSLPFDYPATITILDVVDDTGCRGGVSGQAEVLDAGVNFMENVTLPNCPGGFTGAIQLEVAGDPADYTFTWMDGVTGPSRTSLGEGMYEVAVALVSAPGCPVVRAFDLNLPPLSIDSITFDPPGCPLDPITFTAFVSGGSGNYSYNWDTGTATTPDYTVGAEPGSRTYSLTVEDGCPGGVVTQAITIDLPEFSVGIDGRYSLCNQTTVSVPINVTGPADNYLVTINRAPGGDTVLTVGAGLGELILSEATELTITNFRREADGCPGTIAEATASVIDPQISFEALITQIGCNGQNEGRIELQNPATVPVTVTWDDGSNGLVRDNLAPGSYTVSIADQVDASCSRDSTFVIAEPGPLLVALSRGPALCPGLTETLVATVDGGTPPYTFRWDNVPSPDSTFTFQTVPGTNTYNIEVTDACNQVATASQTYTFEEVTATVDGTYGICNAPFNAEVPLTLSGSSRYVVYLNEGGVSRRLDLIGSTILNYTDTVTVAVDSVFGADGCQGLAIGQAQVVNPVVDVVAAVNNISCLGGSDGNIQLAVNGTDGAGYDFVWSDPTLSGPVVQDLGVGAYTVTVTEQAATRCEFIETYSISEPEGLAIGLNVPTVTCQQEQVEVVPIVTGGTPPYTYNWAGGTSTDSIFRLTTVGGATSYDLLVTDFCGQVATDQVSFNLTNATASINGTYSVCNVDEVAVPLQLSGSSSYRLEIRENGVNRTVVATGDTSLRYSASTLVELISLIDADGCPGTLLSSQAEVTDVSWNVVVNITDVPCLGGAAGEIEVMVNGGIGDYTYTWDRPGVNGPNPTGLVAGSYQLAVRDLTPDACAWDTTIIISEPSSQITLVEQDIRPQTCNELAYAEITYTGGTGALSYAWSNGTSGPVLSEVEAGTYELSITDENGCLLTQTVPLRDNRAEVFAGISATAGELSCAQPSLTLSAQQNTRPVSYTWTNAEGTLLGTDRQIEVSAPGTYQVVARDATNGCSDIDSVTIGLNDALLSLDLPAVHALNCIQDEVDLNVGIDNFTGRVSYRWTLDGNPIAGANTAILTGINQPGTYTVEVLREDNGCTTTATTEVVIDREAPRAPPASPRVVLNCFTPVVELSILASDSLEFAWFTVNGRIISAADSIAITTDQPGRYDVVVTNPANGCTTETFVIVERDDATVVPDAGEDQVLICDGIGTAMEGTYSPVLPGTQGKWYLPSGELLSEGDIGFAREAGTYTFEAIHPESGCSSFATVNIISEAPTGVDYSIQHPPCPEVGGSLFVRSVEGTNGPFTFSSPTGETDPLGGGLRGLAEGTHTLIVTDALGCTYEEAFQIFPAGEFTGGAEEVLVRLGQMAELSVFTNRSEEELTSWTWSNLPDSTACTDCPNPQVMARESFIASLMLIDSNGCTVELRQNVVVDERDLVFMPTAFSPGRQDGNNDVYTVYGRREFVPNVDYLRIYNRWGNLVFENADFNVNDDAAGWDGVFNGQLAQGGTYVYSVGYTMDDGTRETLRGTLTLVR